MGTLVVKHEDADRFRVAIRGHELVVDQPVCDGGGDDGPTPTELFVAGLASCVAFYARRFLARHRLAEDDLSVECAFAMSHEPPARVTDVRLVIKLPAGFPAARRTALQRVVEHCTVHNSIRIGPQVAIELDVDESVA